MGHTKEPWTVSGKDDGPGQHYLHIGGADSPMVLASMNDVHIDTPANARRIVAAVNHTRNIPNEALEAVRLEEVVQGLRDILHDYEPNAEGHVLPYERLNEICNILSHFPARSSTVEPDAHNVSDAGSTPAAPTKPRGEK